LVIRVVNHYDFVLHLRKVDTLIIKNYISTDKVSDLKNII
jgi:hypothetical protein